MRRGDRSIGTGDAYVADGGSPTGVRATPSGPSRIAAGTTSDDSLSSDDTFRRRVGRFIGRHVVRTRSSERDAAHEYPLAIGHPLAKDPPDSGSGGRFLRVRVR
ncbi:pr111.2 [rat cytomegalovirus strain Maastricht]|uniref:Pr111.2 n=1 Tax=Rat cytomegalovirus (strain Maastricht) TaxID=79700 RepID=Q9DW89_RCMVM|nr:pr111.2 [rat cytomegalovirus strain Maastricht]AAF99201.1 pr111.2 [rat cytomegalovirus strain Maastricht]